MVTSPQITSLHPVNPDDARLDHARKQVGFIPNMYVNMATGTELDERFAGYRVE